MRNCRVPLSSEGPSNGCSPWTTTAWHGFIVWASRDRILQVAVLTIVSPRPSIRRNNNSGTSVWNSLFWLDCRNMTTVVTKSLGVPLHGSSAAGSQWQKRHFTPLHARGSYNLDIVSSPVSRNDTIVENDKCFCCKATWNTNPLPPSQIQWKTPF